MTFRNFKPVKQMTGSLITGVFFLILFSLAACSSAPKKPAEIFVDRNMAANQLDLAIRTANQGLYADALLILEDARRFAVSSDDPPLLIKTSIARGNFLFSLGLHDEAFLDWEAAREEGEISGERDLAILARIYAVRGRLVLMTGAGTKTGAEEIRDQVNGLISSIKSNRLALATGYLVLGMAEKELEHYPESERALRRALDIHEKDRYLEEAAYDWYFMASVFSVAGRYDDALAALQTAIAFDRRAENGFGLASSWQAVGEVYLKKNLAEESVRAFYRAADIFRAIGLEESASKAEARAVTAGL